GIVRRDGLVAGSLRPGRARCSLGIPRWTLLDGEGRGHRCEGRARTPGARPWDDAVTTLPKPNGKWTLRLEKVRSGYGPVSVLQGVDVAVAPGECVVLLGANGVGKTTLLRTVSGVVRPREGGTIEF